MDAPLAGTSNFLGISIILPTFPGLKIDIQRRFNASNPEAAVAVSCSRRRCRCFDHLVLPFEDQVEPLGHRRRPKHCHPGGPAEEVGDGEEEQEGGLGVSDVSRKQPHLLLAHHGPLEALGHPHSLRVHCLHPAVGF